VKDLRSAIEDYLGHGIDAVVASTPNLVALYEEDMADAFEYLDLEFQFLPYWRSLVK